MIDVHGRGKLADFGRAKARLFNSSVLAELKESDSRDGGNLLYMAPELWVDVSVKRAVSVADTYSFSILA